MQKHLPRLLNEKDAADYCGVGPSCFRSHVTVSPLRIGNRNRWDKEALDKWVDNQSGIEPNAHQQKRSALDDWRAKRGT